MARSSKKLYDIHAGGCNPKNQKTLRDHARKLTDARKNPGVAHKRRDAKIQP